MALMDDPARDELMRHIEDYAVLTGYWGEGIVRGTLLILPFAILGALALALLYLLMTNILVRSFTIVGSVA